MKKVLVCILAIAWMAMLVGCGEPGGKTATQKDFEKLYKQYSTRFYDKLTTEPETTQAAQVFAEAARIWEDVFGPHKDVLARRSEEILKELDTSPPVQEDIYIEIATWTRSEPPAGQAQQTIVLKQLVWSPTGAAQVALGDFLGQLLSPQSRMMRQMMGINAILFWETLDRNPDHPRLLLRQGPMIFIFDLSRKDDYYQADKIRWLRPKSMGPLAAPQPPATGPAAPPAAGPPPAPPTTPPLPPTTLPPPTTPPPPPTPPATPPATPPGK